MITQITLLDARRMLQRALGNEGGMLAWNKMVSSIQDYSEENITYRMRDHTIVGMQGMDTAPYIECYYIG